MANEDQRVQRMWKGLGVGLCSAAAVLLFVACDGRQRPGVAPRHLLLITVENLRADHVSSLGYERRTTALLRPDQPIVLDLDRIASSGVSFAQAYSGAADANRSLMPLFAGKQDDSGPSLAASFVAQGYRSACFVNGRSLMSESQEVLGSGFEQTGFFETDEEALAAAVGWLEVEAPKGGSFFTWLHLGGIRAPFTGDPFKDRLSAPSEVAGGRSAAEFVTALDSGSLERGADTRRHLNDLYDARLVRVVELINSFFFFYKNNFGGAKFWDESVIALAGSSGCDFGEGGANIGDSDSLREAGLRVPLFLSHPSSMTGERILGEVVELADLAPTLREWFGLEQAGAKGNRSLLALTDSKVRHGFSEHAALSLSGGGAFSLRNARYRLTVMGGERKLFDLHSDPTEGTNVAGLHPDVVAEIIAGERARIKRLGLSF